MTCTKIKDWLEKNEKFVREYVKLGEHIMTCPDCTKYAEKILGKLQKEIPYVR